MTGGSMRVVHAPPSLVPISPRPTTSSVPPPYPHHAVALHTTQPAIMAVHPSTIMAGIPSLGDGGKSEVLPNFRLARFRGVPWWCTQSRYMRTPVGPQRWLAKGGIPPHVLIGPSPFPPLKPPFTSSLPKISPSPLDTRVSLCYNPPCGVAP